MPLRTRLFSALSPLVLAGCAGSSSDPASGESSDLDEMATVSVTVAPHKYDALVGTWRASGSVPATSDDGVPVYEVYTFDADGSFVASRLDEVPVQGRWQVYTTLPELPRIELTWNGSREAYIFSMQCDLLLLDGIDSVLVHELTSLPIVPDGHVCQDTVRNSTARCMADIGSCDDETHRCLPPS